MNDKLRPDEVMAFDVYFASIRSMQFHPGAGTKDHKQLSREECRDEALAMVAIRRSLLQKKE